MKMWEERSLSSKVVYRGGMIDLQVDEVLLPNGKKVTRDLIKHPGSVGILAITEDQKMVMVEQFRKPLERSIIEIPAGKLDLLEDPLDCAKRELEEETGFTAEKMEHLVSFYTSPGYTNEVKHIYKATQLQKGPQRLDEDEFVEIKILTLSACRELIKEGEICDVKTLYAIRLFESEYIV